MTYLELQKDRTFKWSSIYYLLSVAIFAVGIAIFGSTLSMVVLGWEAMPLLDQWSNMTSLKTDFWSHLFDQHNEHRIVFARLVFWLDWKLCHETNIVNLAFILILQTSLAFLMFRVATKLVSENWAEKLWLAGTVLCILFFARQFENFLWGFQVQFVGVLAAAVATFVAAGTLSSSRSALLVVLLGSISVGMLSNGVFVPPIAFLLACWMRRSLPYLFITGLAALMLPAAYLIGYHTPEKHSDPLLIFQHLPSVFMHFLAQLGGPFGREPVSAMIIGAVAFVISLVIAKKIVSSKPDSYRAVILSIFLFVWATAAITAMGREQFGLEQALSSRYTGPTSLFWIALLIGFMDYIKPYLKDKKALLILVPLPFVVAMALFQPRLIKRGLEWSAAHYLGKGGLVANLPDPMLERSHPNINLLLEMRSGLARNRTSIFAEDWTHWLGDALADHVKVGEDFQCMGSSLSFTPFPGGLHVTGSAMDSNSRSSLDRIVFVNANNKIAGYGFGGFSAGEVGIVGGQGRTFYSGATSITDEGAVRIYALTSQASHPIACRIK